MDPEKGGKLREASFEIPTRLGTVSESDLTRKQSARSVRASRKMKGRYCNAGRNLEV